MHAILAFSWALMRATYCQFRALPTTWTCHLMTLWSFSHSPWHSYSSGAGPQSQFMIDVQSDDFVVVLAFPLALVFDRNQNLTVLAHDRRPV